jgi:hypothetical protein
MRGRHLAGFGEAEPAEVALPAATAAFTPAPRVPSDDISELRRMEKADDADGNGIFDNSRRRPITYQDAGIFANNWALPAYITRSKSFAESEVRDITTGAPVVYVPSGAVSIDDNAKLAFLTGNAYMPIRGMLPPASDLPMVPIDAVAVSPATITAAAAATQAPNVEGGVTRSVDIVTTPVPVTPVVATTGMSNIKLALLAATVGFGVGWLMSPSKPKKATL